MYEYQAQKQELFTENGQVMFLKVRDKAKHLLSMAGAFRVQEAISGVSGDSWTMLACVDRLVELGEVKELTKPGDVAGQYRVFTGNM